MVPSRIFHVGESVVVVVDNGSFETKPTVVVAIVSELVGGNLHGTNAQEIVIEAESTINPFLKHGDHPFRGNFRVDSPYILSRGDVSILARRPLIAMRWFGEEYSPHHAVKIGQALSEIDFSKGDGMKKDKASLLIL
jgi:hypothetical protein